jgi:predicted enzyme related to lactoylglutathione lyase
MGKRTRYPPGAFCLVGLATSTPANAKGFYKSLFGWQAEDLPAGPAGEVSLLRHSGHDVAILYRQMPEARAAGAAPHWTSYISVENADATAARANELGGAAVFREPFDVPDAGRVAAIRDPTGAIVSLWQPRSRIGAALVNDVSAWCWNELATSDVERAKRFFTELFGWSYETDDRGHTTIINAGHRAGGIREQNQHERSAEPNWLPYFTVANIEHAVGTAEQAYGRQLAPTIEVNSGRLAVITDPQGAAFGVFDGDTDP